MADGRRAELAGYTAQDLVQELTHRPEFFGAVIFSNRPLEHQEAQPDDQLFIMNSPIPNNVVIKILAKAIDALASKE